MRIWNITHLTMPAAPKTITVSGKRCAPNKFIELDSITKKEANLVGSYLFVGDFLPAKEYSDLEPLTREESSEYLSKLTKEELVLLASNVSPKIPNADSKSKFWLKAKVLNAVYSESFEVNPSFFLWTNMWERVGSGYREK